MSKTKTMPPERLRSLKTKVRSTYIENGQDERVLDHLHFIVENAKDFHDGAGSQRRCLFVIGPSGTGKTTSLRHHCKNIPEFQPRLRGKEMLYPYIAVTSPKKGAPLDILVKILEEMKLPTEGNERELTKILKEQVKHRELLVLHIDEGQHPIRSNTPKAIKGVQDFLKELVDTTDWPLHVILSGVKELENLRTGDGQIERRSHVMRFHRMSFPDDVEWLRVILHNVAVEQCHLKLADTVNSDEFLGRLCRAMNGGWGSIIEMVQEASFIALANGRTELNINHFAYRYELISACEPGENIFTSSRWNQLKPKHSLMALQEEDE